MAHALPRHVGDVQQAVDAAEVHERAVIGEVLDHALEHRALRSFSSSCSRSSECSLSTTARRETTTLLRLRSSLMSLNSSSLPSRYTGIAHGAHIDQRTRQECADVLDVDGETALDLAADAAGDGGVLLEGFFQFVPHHGALGFLARQHGFAEAIFEGVQRHLDFVADGDVELACVVTELFDRHDAFGLQAGIDHHDVGADFDDDAGDDGAGLQLGQIVLALFEQFCE